MDTQARQALVDRYTPQLVLYPDIVEATGPRPEPEDIGYPRLSPLQHDYHPRDLSLVLENSVWFTRRWGRWRRVITRSKRTPNMDQMLAEMSKGEKRDIDVLQSVNQHDPEGFWDAYRKLAPGHDRRCYAYISEVADVDNPVWVIQYWYPYFYNDFWNKHEMDWETVMVVLKVDKDGGFTPSIVAGSAHHGGSWLPWNDAPRANGSGDEDLAGTHPVIFVAAGSHANYFYGPARYETSPPIVSELLEGIRSTWGIRLVTRHSRQLRDNRSLVDYTTSRAEGHVEIVPASVIPTSKDDWDGDWRWMRHRGRWGSPGGAVDLQFGDSGPVGPAEQTTKFDHPMDWIDEHCKRPLPRESVTPATYWM